MAKKPAELSGGMPRRSAWPALAAIDPELILYDGVRAAIMSDVINGLILNTRRHHPVAGIVAAA